MFCLLFVALMTNLSVSQRGWTRSPFPYHISSPGDRSAIHLKVSNVGSAPRNFKFGPRIGQRTSQMIPAYGSHDYLIQCLKRNDVQVTPKLHFTLGDRDNEFDSWITRESDPLRIIWNRGAPQTSNRLKWSLRSTLRSIYNNQAIIRVRSDNFLPDLSVWSRTKIFLTSLKALSDLDEQQRFLLKLMVATGTTLVIGTGDMEGDEALLQQFTPVGLGEVKSNSGSLLEQFPRVSSYRMLYPQNEAYPLVMTDHEPIAVESQLGLGKVRVLAVRLNEVTSSPIATQVLSSDRRATEQLEEWLDLSMPPLTEPHRLLNDQVWILVFFIPVVFLISRRRWRITILGSLLWILSGLINPPLFAPTSIRQAHMLYIPVDEGAVVLAQADLNSFDRGGRVERLNSHAITLLSTETQGACLIHTLHNEVTAPQDESRRKSKLVQPSDNSRRLNRQIKVGVTTSSQSKRNSSQTSWLVLDSDLGERQRFKYVAYVPRVPRLHKVSSPKSIPNWPIGPWSGAQLRALKLYQQDLILPANLSGLKAWRLPTFAPEAPPKPLIFRSAQTE
jgi:hypothetical protein